MNISKIVMGFLGMLMLINCQRRLMSDSPTDPAQTLEETAISVFQQDYEVEENTSGDFALISKTWMSKPNDVFHTLSFVVYDQSKMSVIFKKTLDQGSVKWMNDDQIFFESIPGRSENQRRKYIYNIRTQQVHPINE